ncbi:MAG: ribonuclease E/G, partial [Bacillota bacterium]|nr:ribonuclease E/G [Bacillota bacterium]
SPALKLRVEYFSKSIDLFEFYQIEPKISKALARKIWLKCGGYLVLDHTEALTVIDVNTGKYVGGSNLEDTVLKTNLEAAKEIAKQLRLRDIGGIIIIDFIDMREPQHQQMILDTLKHSLKKDRTKTTVVGMTGLGLIEMTRKKIRQVLASVMHSDCPYCDGTGKILSPESIARNVEKEINRYFTQTIANAIQVEVHPSVATILTGVDGQALERMEKIFNKRIVVKESKEVKHEEIKIKEIDINSLL